MTIENIKQLRALTSAGMNDCRAALLETGGDIQQAVDLIKIRGQNIAAGRSNQIAAEGRISLAGNYRLHTMLEINCQTDFTANSAEFRTFVGLVSKSLLMSAEKENSWDPQQDNDLELARQTLSAQTKENIVIRRCAIVRSEETNQRVFTYLHPNHKIGVLLSMCAVRTYDGQDSSSRSEFIALGEEIAMQIAAMNPMVISVDKLDPNDVSRQRTIFEGQLRELNKPEKSWPKILEGKMLKWQKEVCLLDQESVVHPKQSIRELIEMIYGGKDIVVCNFVRYQVGL